MELKRKALIVFKVAFAALGLSSVVQEIIVLSQRGAFDAINFFSYFTIISNILAGAALLVSAYYVLQNRSRIRVDIFRGATTLYMALTGVVFSLLLSNLPNLTAVPWDNIVLHYIIPVAMVIDWVLHPPKTKFAWKYISLWLVFPVVYVTYSLVRGSITDWYPYPFLNPANGGYSQVLLTSLFITIFTVSAAVLLARISAFRAK